MADFDLAFRFMAPHEWNHKRNFTNDPDDPGGATKFGITLASWKMNGSLGDLDGDGDVDSQDVELIDEDRARHFYRSRYWIWQDVEDDFVAAKLFDMGVNMGPGTAVVYLQSILKKLGASIVVDARLGPKTIQATNASTRTNPTLLLAELAGAQSAHYEGWIGKNPRREKFRAGLMNRATAIPARTMEANA